MNKLVFETEIAADHKLHIRLPDELPPGCKVKVTVEDTVKDEILDQYEPRTDIGRKLIAARRAYLQRGGELMDWDQINEEVRHRRGELGGKRRGDGSLFWKRDP